MRRGGLWGFIAPSGELAIPYAFQDVMAFSEGVAGAASQGRWGYIDRRGAWMADPVYLEAWPFSEGLAPVRSASNGRWGYVGRSIPPLFGGQTFEEAGPFKDGLALVVEGGRKRYIDLLGRDAFGGAFEEARDYSEGLAAVRSGDRWGYVDRRGRMAIPPKFEAAGPYSEGLAAARLKGRWGFVDKSGDWAVRNVHEGVWPFSEGLAAVRKGKKLGYVDASGKLKVPYRYDVPLEGSEAGRFSEGLAAVLSGGKTLFIDKKGSLVIRGDFAAWKGEAPRFRWGVACLETTKGEWRYVNRGGRYVGKPPDGFSRPVWGTASGLVPYRSDTGAWGYRNSNGTVIIPPFLDVARPFSEGVAAVSARGRWWYIAAPE